MDSIEQAYLQIIFEAQYDNEKWQRYGKYQEIEIYYNIEHIRQRLSIRYQNINFGSVRKAINAFLKFIVNDKLLD